MSQSKVKDFFSNRKGRDVQPAKRRKVEIPVVSVSPQEAIGYNFNQPSNSHEKNFPIPTISTPNSNSFEEDAGRSSISTCAMPDTFKGVKATISESCSRNTRTITRSSRTRSRQAISQKDSQNQKKISDLFNSRSKESSPQHNKNDLADFTDSNSSHNSNCATESDPEKISAEITKLDDNVFITEECTLVTNDEDSLMVTPRKRNLTITSESEPPKTRKCKVPVRKLVAENPAMSESAKKKLNLQTFGVKKAVAETEEPDVKAEQKSDKTSLLRLLSDVESPDKPLSPLPKTPLHSGESSPRDAADGDSLSQPPSAKLHDISQKLKMLSKMNGKALKNRLKQSGKLGDVQQRVENLGKSLDRKEGSQPVSAVEAVPVTHPEAEKEKLPAYQRFEHLAQPGKPHLTLPFSYKTLEGAFQAMDTVVSMLHNRSEVCTFSKLKAAVQNFTKKNFEKNAVGQIKTVVPDAYVFTQEKHACRKTNTKAYDLTVEANLSHEVNENPDGKVAKTIDGKPLFTASALIRRKQKFHNILLGLVMERHKTFLSSLSPPLSIPYNKLTRWHPKFRLEEVPDVTPSDLPQPPDVKVYHTAKDVLEAQKGRLNPRVEAALTKVVAENEKKNQEATTSKNIPSTAASPSSSPSSKGIPAFLLAKIRAKEALKMEAALTRNPEEENKLKMMSHLPEMIRILRSYFVLEKKPALPIEAVYEKLETSYKSGISRRDVEQHVQLLLQLAPEFISVVEIKRGKFLKLDKNIDAQTVSARISKAAQAGKV